MPQGLATQDPDRLSSPGGAGQPRGRDRGLAGVAGDPRRFHPLRLGSRGDGLLRAKSASIRRTSCRTGATSRAGSCADGYIPIGLPAGVAQLPVGHHDLRTQDMQVRVAKGAGGTLYIVYDQDRIDRLMYAYAVLPVALGLAAVFAVSLLSYRVSKRLVTPVNWLAREVAAWDPRQPDIDALAPHRLPADIGSGEARQLAKALHTLGERVESLRRARAQLHPRCQPRTAHAADGDPRRRATCSKAERELSARGERSLPRIQRRGPRHGGGDRRLPDPRARSRHRTAGRGLRGLATSSTRKSTRCSRCWPASRWS